MVLEIPKRDRRAERREATKAEILEAAWAQVRADGFAALSLRDLARTVGMQAPSLYSYFDSKNAIYDAMYAQGAPAVQAEDDMPGSLSLHPSSGATCRRLAELEIDTLAPMHAPAYTGDCRAALIDLDRRIAML